MAAVARRIGEKWRVVREVGGKLEPIVDDDGNPIDGGGYDTRREAIRRVRQVNAENGDEEMPKDGPVASGGTQVLRGPDDHPPFVRGGMDV